MRALLIAAALAATATVAHAYPQYQLSREQTCGACHLSPTGGGLLNVNGELAEEDDATWSGDPTFLHGAATLPDWLHLGGDVRFAAGARTAAVASARPPSRCRSSSTARSIRARCRSSPTWA
jgi:hypothetical protein